MTTSGCFTELTGDPMMASGTTYYLGVDVGTAGVRAALVDPTGTILSTATQVIQVFEPKPDFYEQSSEDIWAACCKVVKSVTADVDVSLVRGIGFDATCSMVVLDKDAKPISVSLTGIPDWNIIMWLDHRAVSQADRINATHHEVLKYVGGAISVEMQTPKLLWLKENMPNCWSKAGHFMDLCDFLTWRATGSLSRSLCSLVCKWGYLADPNVLEGWSDSLLRQFGLDDLAEDDFRKIGKEALPPGEPCASGLSEAAAKDLGLAAGTAVATGMVDAHCGGLGALGCRAVPECLPEAPELTERVAIICGTSTCIMAMSREPTFVPGVWGPYYSAMVPALWLNEGGQSAAGKLIDHIMESHSAYSWVKEQADSREIHVSTVLNETLHYLREKQALTSQHELARHLHIWPDFHGNRSPLADPSLRGMMVGLSLSEGTDDLAVRYLATLHALAYSTRHILEAMTKEGHNIRVIHACGSLAKNPVFVQTCADVTGIPVVIPDAPEPVLLGAAMLGACAAGTYLSLQEAMHSMGGKGSCVEPNTDEKPFHEKKYAVFLKMLDDQRKYQQMMT